jgi:UDP-N-acetylmuramoyl-L-alanyl-D-glutamate--2,6-diaminopimelate ligase
MKTWENRKISNAAEDTGLWAKLLKLARTGTPVCTHSGKVEHGDIFVALPGTRVDGAEYIPQALERGAAYVVTRHVPPGLLDVRGKIVIHPNPAQALGELAGAYFGTEALRARVIGITGTNGKTTTTYLLEHLLTGNGFKVGVIGTVNYRWGGKEYPADMTTPDCLRLHHLLAQMDKDGVDWICMEVSSHALDQDRVAGICFDYAVFTNLTQDHLDYHLNLENYFQAKAKLFTPKQSRKPKAIINGDDKFGQRLKKTALDPLCYGLGEDNDLIAASVIESRQGLRLECKFHNKQWSMSSSLVGRFNAFNLLAALGVGLKLGMGEMELKVLEGFQGVPGRLQRVGNKKGLNIFVDYAHTPDALENVCKTLKNIDFDRLIVLFGCGGNRDRAKRPLMGQAVARYADLAVITSDNPRNEEPEAIIRDILPGIKGRVEIEIEPDRKKAIKLAISRMEKGDVLLIAGKGHEDYQEIKGKKIPFHDARVVEEIIDAFDY